MLVRMQKPGHIYIPLGNIIWYNHSGNNLNGSIVSHFELSFYCRSQKHPKPSIQKAQGSIWLWEQLFPTFLAKLI